MLVVESGRWRCRLSDFHPRFPNFNGRRRHITPDGRGWSVGVGEPWLSRVPSVNNRLNALAKRQADVVRRVEALVVTKRPSG